MDSSRRDRHENLFHVDTAAGIEGVVPARTNDLLRRDELPDEAPGAPPANLEARSETLRRCLRGKPLVVLSSVWNFQREAVAGWDATGKSFVDPAVPIRTSLVLADDDGGLAAERGQGVEEVLILRRF